MSEMNATQLLQRQVRYDTLHHRMRLEWLESLHRNSYEETLYKQSLAVIRNPQNGMAGLNSVDVSDSQYVSELDEFAVRNGK